MAAGFFAAFFFAAIFHYLLRLVIPTSVMRSRDHGGGSKWVAHSHSFVASVAATTSRIAIQDVFLSDLESLVKRRAEVPHNPGSIRLTKKRLKKYYYFFFLAAFLAAGFFAAFFFAAIVLYLLNVMIWTR